MQFDNGISRRRFLKTLTMAGTAAVLIPLMASTSTPAYASGYAAVGKTEDFTEGDFKKVTLPTGQNVYITKKGSDFVALSSKCTHRGCDVLWVPSAHNFHCPCHGARFDDSGKVVNGPADRPLPAILTKVEGGQVLVQS